MNPKKASTNFFPSNTLFLTFLTQHTTEATVSVCPILRPEDLQPTRYSLLKEAPDQKEVLSDFMKHQLKFRDMQTMIEQSRKRDNKKFGQHIVNAVSKVADE